MRKVLLITTLAVAAAIVPAGGTAVAAPTAPSGATTSTKLLSDVIPLPAGWRPEGIEIGRRATFYVGSLADGAIYRGSLITGRGAVLVPGRAGGATTGLEVDARNRLFAAGGGSGTGRVYDPDSGRLLADWQFGPAGGSFINDVVVTRDAAYFTDSVRPLLFKVPFGRGGRLPAGFQTLTLSGDFVQTAGNNANGIETTPDGRALLVVQSSTGGLFRVDPRTGVATAVDLGGTVLTNGDGLLRRGRILYAVQNRLNQIAAVRLNRAGTSGRLVTTLTDPDLDVPATVADFGPFLYAVNARFTTPPTPETTYEVVRVSG